MKYRVKWKKGGEEGVENEASWFLLDQQGKFWVYGPMTPVRMVSKAEYDELTPLINVGGNRWLSVDEIAALEAENAKLREKVERLEKGISAVESLINDSHGVYGLHLNGDLAPWASLRTGGQFEEWLLDFDEALKEG